MKNILSISASILLVGFIASLAWMHLTKNNTDEFVQLIDRIHPMVPKKYIYVVTSDAYAVPKYDGAYEYTQEGVNQDGKRMTVSFLAMQKLRNQAFLKLDAKGKYIQTYEEVLENQIPKNVRKLLLK